jgi:Kef-type K+ transport system membrane component KefB
MILLLQIAVILIVARIVRWVFLAFRQPAVIGEMVAGLMLGPSLFGWLAPQAYAGLFAPASLPPLNALSEIGLVLFMFIVGLRLGAQQSGASRRTAAITGATSIVVPFVLGALVAASLHAALAPRGVAILPFALFVGAAMSMTAFPVLARILLDQDLFDTEIGATAIACAAFDDVAGWLILAGVVTLVHVEDPGMLLVRALMLGGYLAVMLFAVRPLMRGLAERRGPRFGTTADDLAPAVVVLLLSAIATQWLGVHALFGAFFAGLMMPRGGIERAFVERVEPLTLTLLLPLFFAFSGLRTQVALIDSYPLWLDAGLLMAVAIAGKGVASALAARVMGMGWRDAGTLGALLNTRGLIELVILSIGLDLGILSPVVFSMLVLMALVTTFMTSPLIALLRKDVAKIEALAEGV